MGDFGSLADDGIAAGLGSGRLDDDVAGADRYHGHGTSEIQARVASLAKGRV